MDNFMDKLVEKMNLQGQTRAQAPMETSERKDAQIKDLSTRIEKLESNNGNDISDKVSDKINESNARVVELASQYKASLEEAIHKENVRCYRNTQAMVEENVAKIPDQIKEEIKVQVSECIAEINSKYDSLKSLLIASIITSAISIVGVIVILLRIFKVI